MHRQTTLWYLLQIDIKSNSVVFKPSRDGWRLPPCRNVSINRIGPRMSFFCCRIGAGRVAVIANLLHKRVSLLAAVLFLCVDHYLSVQNIEFADGNIEAIESD